MQRKFFEVQRGDSNHNFPTVETKGLETARTSDIHKGGIQRRRDLLWEKEVAGETKEGKSKQHDGTGTCLPFPNATTPQTITLVATGL